MRRTLIRRDEHVSIKAYSCSSTETLVIQQFDAFFMQCSGNAAATCGAHPINKVGSTLDLVILLE
jgi:hypothetical protein